MRLEGQVLASWLRVFSRGCRVQHCQEVHSGVDEPRYKTPSVTTSSHYQFHPYQPSTMRFSLLSLAAVLPMAAAHFTLQYPTSRGFDEDTMPEFPCGGMSQSSNRTQLPLDGSFPVALEMGHIQTALEVLLALGTDPGTNYNITLVPTFQITGLGAFCLPHVDISSQAIGVKITDGMNATIQVQSSGDPTGGLYAVCLFLRKPLVILTEDCSAPMSSSPLMSPTPSLHPARTTPTSRRPPSPVRLLSAMLMSPRLRASLSLARARARLPPLAVLFRCRLLLGECLVLHLLAAWPCCRIHL